MNAEDRGPKGEDSWRRWAAASAAASRRASREARDARGGGAPRALKNAERALRLHDREVIAFPRFRSFERACSELDNGECAQRESNAPRTYGAADAHDASVARHEGDVDREAHEEGVDAVAGRDDERGLGRQRGSAEQAFSARRRLERAFERRGDDQVGALVAQDPAILRSLQDRIKK